MGADFFPCDQCSETICDAGPFYMCENCDDYICVDCEAKNNHKINVCTKCKHACNSISHDDCDCVCDGIPNFHQKYYSSCDPYKCPCKGNDELHYSDCTC